MEKLEFPAPGDTVAADHPSPAFAKFLAERRSVTAALLSGPGPDSDTLQDILNIAVRVPDHRKVVPFRMLTFTGDERAKFGDVLVSAAADRTDDVKDRSPDTIRSLFLRAPVIVAVVSTVDKAHKTPEWEQVLTAGLVCYNMLLAASAHGFAGQWLTEWMAYDDNVAKAMGLTDDEKIVGFVYLGTAQSSPQERQRPDLTKICSPWTATP